MPKIFKENKFALFLANVFTIVLWIAITTIFKNILLDYDLPFYFYSISELIRFLPPVWITYYLWIVRKI